MSFSEHFPFTELITYGRHPEIVNVPPPEMIPNGERLSQKLEQAREIWSKHLGRECHVRVTYGFRCAALNAACGSTSKTSAHLEFSAGDVIPEGMTLREAWDVLRADPTFMEDVDQLIIERGCIHIGLAVKAHNFIPRHQLHLEKDLPDGTRTYPLWAIWPAEGVSH